MGGKKNKKNENSVPKINKSNAPVANAAPTSGDPTANTSGEKKVVKKTPGKGKRSGKSKHSCNVDIFTEAAMDNAYYVCHNIQDVLKIRGFPWPEAQKKKKKGKKK